MKCPKCNQEMAQFTTLWGPHRCSNCKIWVRDPDHPEDVSRKTYEEWKRELEESDALHPL